MLTFLLFPLLKYWYANSSVRVKWNGTVGEYIPVKKRVRQGSVLPRAYLSVFQLRVSDVFNRQFFTLII